MNAFELAKKTIINSDGIATTFDLKTAGLEKYSISNLCKEGLIVRIRHGYYSLPDSLVAEEQLLSKLLPEGIYSLGKTAAIFNGISLHVYDKERTICDCFKYRNQMDSETFAKAINAYSVDKEKNLSNLSKYAKQLRVYKKVMEMMEVLLNG